MSYTAVHLALVKLDELPLARYAQQGFSLQLLEITDVIEFDHSSLTSCRGTERSLARNF